MRTILNVSAGLAFPLDVINLVHGVSRGVLREICQREDLLRFAVGDSEKIHDFLMIAKTGFDTREWVRYVERVASKCDRETAQSVREKWMPKMRAV